MMNHWWMVVLMSFCFSFFGKAQCPNTRIVAIMVNACNLPPNAATEAANEFVVIYTSTGFNTSNIRLDFDINNNMGGNQNNDILVGANACGIGFGNIGGYVGCTSSQLIPVGNNFQVPPMSIVVLQTSNNADYPYDFSELCNDPFYKCFNKYLIASTCTRTMGAFTDNPVGMNRITRFRIQGDPCAEQVIAYNQTFLQDGMYLRPGIGGPFQSNCSFPQITVPNLIEPELDPFSDDSGCTMYRLPRIWGIGLSGNQGYYTGPNGTGTKYNEFQIINQSTSVYIYDSRGACSAQVGPYTITIVNPATASLQNLSGYSSICPGQCIDYRLNIAGWQSGITYLPFIDFNIPGVTFPIPIEANITTQSYDFRICLNGVTFSWNPQTRLYNIPLDHIGKQIGMFIRIFDDFNYTCNHNYSSTPLTFNLVSSPTATEPTPLQRFLSGGVATFNLTERNDQVLGGQSGTVVWYSDTAGTPINNPNSFTIIDDAVVYARVQSNGCFSGYVPLTLNILGSEVTVTIEAESLVCAPDERGATLSFSYVFDNPGSDSITFCPQVIRDGILLNIASIESTSSGSHSFAFAAGENDLTRDSLVIDIKVCDLGLLPEGVTVHTPEEPFVLYVITPPAINAPSLLSDTACLLGGMAEFQLDTLTARIAEDIEDYTLHWYSDTAATIPYTQDIFIITHSDSLFFMLEGVDCDFGPYTFHFTGITPLVITVDPAEPDEIEVCPAGEAGETVVMRWISNNIAVDLMLHVQYTLDGGPVRDTSVVLTGGEAILTFSSVLQNVQAWLSEVAVMDEDCIEVDFLEGVPQIVIILERPEMEVPDALSGCGTFTLPVLSNAQGDTLQYYTQPGGMGQERLPGFTYPFSGNGQNQHTLYVRDTFGVCIQEKPILITVFSNELQVIPAELSREGNPSILCDGINRQFYLLIGSVPTLFVQFTLRFQSGPIDTMITDTATVDLFLPISVEYYDGEPFFNYNAATRTITLGGMNDQAIITLLSVYNVNGCPLLINAGNNKHTITYFLEIPVHEPSPLQTCSNGNGEGNFNLALNSLTNSINGSTGRPVRYYRDAALTDQIMGLNPFVSPSTTIFARVEVLGCFSEAVPLDLQVVQSESAHITITHNNPSQVCDEDSLAGEIISVTFSTNNQALDYTIFYQTIIDGVSTHREVSLKGVVQDVTAHLTVMQSYQLRILNVTADNGTCPIQITWDSAPVGVTVTRVPEFSLPDDISQCGDFILPPIESAPPSPNVTYYSQRGGLGSAMAPGQTVTSTATVYAYFQDGICTAEDSFFIEIFFDTDVFVPTDTSNCGFHVLPEIGGADGHHFSYFTEPFGEGEIYQPGDTIHETTLLFIYDPEGDCPPDDQGPFTITIFNSPEIPDPGELAFCDSLILGNFNIIADSIVYILNGQHFRPGDIVFTGGELTVMAWKDGCESFATFPLESGISGSLGQNPRDTSILWCIDVPFRPIDFLADGGVEGQFFNAVGSFMPGDTTIRLIDDAILYYFISAGQGNCPGDTATFSVVPVLERPDAGRDVDTVFCEPVTITLRDFISGGALDGRFVQINGQEWTQETVSLGLNDSLSLIYILDNPFCGSDTSWWNFSVSGYSNMTAFLTRNALCVGDCSNWQLAPVSSENITVHYTLFDGTESFQYSTFVPAGQGRDILLCNAEAGPSGVILLRPNMNYSLQLDSIVTASGCLYSSPIGPFSIQTYSDVEVLVSGMFCTGDTVVIAGNIFTMDTDAIVVVSGVAPGGCDSIYRVQIDFEDYIADDVEITICRGDNVEVDGIIFSEHHLADSAIIPNLSGVGCDTLRTYTVLILEPSFAVIDTIFCDVGEEVMVGDSLFNISHPVGQVILQGGAANGCDSIVELRLEYRQPVIGHVDTVFCDAADFLEIQGERFDRDRLSGTVILGTAENGCDSLLEVQIRYEIIDPVEVNLRTCDPEFVLEIHGEVFNITNTAGTVVISGASPGGCDSTLIVSIVFEEVILDSLIFTLCRGDSLEIDGLVLDENSTSETIAIPDVTGESCDTLRIYTVLILEPSFAVIDTIFCDVGEEVMVGDSLFNISHPVGQVILQGGAANGCDSIVELRLEYRQPVIGHVDTVFCDAADFLEIQGERFDRDRLSGTVILGTAENGCDSLLEVQVHYEIIDTVRIGFNSCDPDFTYDFRGEIFNRSQPTGMVILEGVSPGGCDSVFVITIDFEEVVLDTLSFSLCRGDSLEIDGLILNESRTMESIAIPDVSGGGGCDTLRTYQVEILEPAYLLIAPVLCDESEEVQVGNIVFNINDPIGIVIFRGAASNGCDSIVEVRLDYRMVVEERIEGVICDPEFEIEINGVIYNIENPLGEEYIDGGSVNGCDSVVVINLQFEDHVFDTIFIETCDPAFSLEVNGTLYHIGMPSGTEIFTGGSNRGCDSTVMIDIRFYNDAYTLLTPDLCAGDSIFINGTWYGEDRLSGADTIFGVTSNGCDSIVEVQINLLQTSSFTLIEQLCDQDEFIMVNGQRYDFDRRAGVEIITGGNRFGCDSTIFVALIFPPRREGFIDTVICDPGFQWEVHGELFDINRPEGTLRLPSGDPIVCDSFVTVRLIFEPYPMGSMQIELCRGETVVIHGREYSENLLMATDTLPGAAANGCDSLVLVNIVLNDASEGEFFIDLCDQDDFYIINGQRYDRIRFSGVEVLEGANRFGCDSIVYIDLNYLDNPVGFVDTLLCNMDYFMMVNGSRYDRSNPTGSEVLRGLAANGCDSMVMIDLFYEEDSIMYTIVPSTCFDDSDAVIVLEDVSKPLPVGYTLDGIRGTINQLPMILSFSSGRNVLLEVETDNQCFVRKVVNAPFPERIRFNIEFMLVGDHQFRLVPRSEQPISSYSWEPHPSLSCLSCAEPVATVSARTTYRLTAVTSGGCIVRDSVTLAPFSVPATVAIPNVFSPNGDGVNDMWYVTTTGTEVIDFVRIQIFDRYGNQLWEKRNPIPNDPAEGWDGRYRNQRLNPGVFVYVIEYRDSRGRNRVFSGDITIIE